MKSATPIIASRRTRRRLVICSVLGGLVAAWLAYEFSSRQSVEQRYRDAVAEADRLDPDWRKGIVAEAPPGNTGRREFGAAGDVVVREDPRRLASAQGAVAAAPA